MTARQTTARDGGDNIVLRAPVLGDNNMTTTTTTTPDVCDHGVPSVACPWACDVEHGAGRTVTRVERRTASAWREALRRAVVDVELQRGYTLWTSRALDDAVAVADAVGRGYYVDVVGAVVDRHTLWLQRHDDNGRALMLDVPGYRYTATVTTAHREARTARRKLGTMPRLHVPDEHVITVLRRAYRGTGALPFTVDNGTRLRAMSDVERALIVREARRFERVERAPLYAPVLDGIGERVPDASAGHGVTVAPGTPERDAVPLRRGTLADRVHAVGVAPVVLDVLAHVADAVAVPLRYDDNGLAVYRTVAPWSDVVRALALDVTPTTASTWLRDAVRRALDVGARTAHVDYVPGEHVATAPVGATSITAHRAPVARGYYTSTGYVAFLPRARRGTHYITPGTPVTSWASGYAWRVVGAHVPDVRRDDGTYSIGCRKRGTCLDTCTALAVTRLRAPVVDVERVGVAPMTAPCTVHAVCPWACETRTARRALLDRLDVAHDDGTRLVDHGALAPDVEHAIRCPWHAVTSCRDDCMTAHGR